MLAYHCGEAWVQSWQSVLDLWWANWQWVKFFLDCVDFPMPVSVPPMFHTLLLPLLMCVTDLTSQHDISLCL
jgi:hypothetical protein